MKNKYFTLILAGVLLVLLMPLISAIFDAGVFEQDTTIDLKLPCEFNGTFCSDSAVCNFTLPYPNTTLMIDNGLMTSTGNGMPNITLPDSSVLGVYRGDYTCEDSGYQDSASVRLEITPTGSTFSTSDSLIYFVVLFILVLLLFFSIRAVVKYSEPEMSAISVGFIAISHLLSMCIIFIIWQVCEKFLYLIPVIDRVLYILWIISFVSLFPMFLIYPAWIIKIVVDNKEFKKLMGLGHTEEEAKRRIKRK